MAAASSADVSGDAPADVSGALSAVDVTGARPGDPADPADPADRAAPGAPGAPGDAAGANDAADATSAQHDKAPRAGDYPFRPREKAPSFREDVSGTGTLTHLFAPRGSATRLGRALGGGTADSGDGIDMGGIDLSGSGGGPSSGGLGSGLSGSGVGSSGLSGSGWGGSTWRGSGSSGAGDVGGAGDAGGTADEEALRRLLRGAVQDLEPTENALEHLHRAVPARRARRRQAVIGAAAAALLIGTAVPAFVHVANSESVATAAPSLIGHDQNSQSQQGDASGAAVGEKPSAGQPTAGTDGRPSGAPDPSDAPSATDGPTDSDSTLPGAVSDEERASIAALPACAPGQLGVASASAGTADANGTVYGTFRIANTSATDCSVSTVGTVAFTTTGAADATKIAIVQHVAGDPAAGLPDPTAEPTAMLLQPEMAYEVQFAFVPSDTCPTAASPTPTPTVAPSGAAEGEDQAANVETQTLTADGDPTEGTIAVTHTPEAGAPTAETTITHACAGTIYRTGILAAS
ncbi:hypothetical protein ACFYPN_17955 [Streptomyces sp. NPDC005576]|uniref:hypothetical protein n=1 Tax=unclassified Streptomyces TaxID=2593676 RepID=UPI0033C9B323